MDIDALVARIKAWLDRAAVIVKSALILYAAAVAGDWLGALTALRALLSLLGVI